MENEIWKPIDGYEGLYLVSNTGKIKTLSRPVKCRKNSDRILSERILSPILRKGYFAIGLSKDNNFKRYSLHRLIAIAFIPNPDNKPHINHKNGIKTDNRSVNLEWCTPSENLIHAFETGLRVPKNNKIY